MADPLLLGLLVLACGLPPQLPVDYRCNAFLNTVKFTAALVVAGSRFHFSVTLAEKLFFLISSLDLGTSSFHGSAAVQVTVPALAVTLTSIFLSPF